MQRRRFLTHAAVASTLPALAACAQAFRIPLDDMTRPADGPGARLDSEGLWREGAAYARWTPSPHNTQPWRLCVRSARSAEVFYDPRRLLPTTDPTGAFTTMGLTMFVDYLALALRPRGFGANVTISERPIDYHASRPVSFATIDLVEATEAPLFDRQLILERKTSRLPYDGATVETEALEALGSISRAYGHAFDWSGDDDFVRWAIDLNRYTLFSDLDDAPTRTELRKWIRPTNEEAADTRDGLWAHCLRFPGWLLQAFFDQHEKWGRGWRARMCGQMLVNGMRGTRTVAWWQGPFETPADWIAAGHAFGYAWLELTRRGIQLHPFGSIITNPHAHERLVSRIGGSEGRSRLWLIARLGRSAVAPRSYRVAEEQLLVDEREVA